MEQTQSKVYANCGCGFQSRGDRAPKVILDAMEHAANTGHSVDVLGTIRGASERMYFTKAAAAGANGGAAAPVVIDRKAPLVSPARKRAILDGLLKKH